MISELLNKMFGSGDEAGADELEKTIDELLSNNAASIIAGIPDIHEGGLQPLLDAEEKGKKRKTVIEALEAAILGDENEEPDANELIAGRNLSVGDALAIDHSAAIVMTFLETGYFVTKHNTKIAGRAGMECALDPDDAERAVNDGLMEIKEVEETEE